MPGPSFAATVSGTRHHPRTLTHEGHSKEGPEGEDGVQPDAGGAQEAAAIVVAGHDVGFCEPEDISTKDFRIETRVARCARGRVPQARTAPPLAARVDSTRLDNALLALDFPSQGVVLQTHFMDLTSPIAHSLLPQYAQLRDDDRRHSGSARGLPSPLCDARCDDDGGGAAHARTKTFRESAINGTRGRRSRAVSNTAAMPRVPITSWRRCQERLVHPAFQAYSPTYEDNSQYYKRAAA